MQRDASQAPQSGVSRVSRAPIGPRHSAQSAWPPRRYWSVQSRHICGTRSCLHYRPRSSSRGIRLTCSCRAPFALDSLVFQRPNTRLLLVHVTRKSPYRIISSKPLQTKEITNERLFPVRIMKSTKSARSSNEPVAKLVLLIFINSLWRVEDSRTRFERFMINISGMKMLIIFCREFVLLS